MTPSEVAAKLDGAIQQVLPGYVVKWTAVIEVMEVDAPCSAYTLGSEGISAWDQLGMLEFGATVRRRSIPEVD